MTATTSTKPAAKVKPVPDRVGSCTGVRSTGRCRCPEFIRRADQVAGSVVCAREGCGHTQQVHSLIEVTTS